MSNAAAIKLYESLGFTSQGIRRAYYTDNREDALIMWRDPLPTRAAVILGIETSCDETAAALVTRDGEIRANVVASQADLHARFGGVVPEVASRRHLELSRRSCARRSTRPGRRSTTSSSSRSRAGPG